MYPPPQSATRLLLSLTLLSGDHVVSTSSFSSTCGLVCGRSRLQLSLHLPMLSALMTHEPTDRSSPPPRHLSKPQSIQPPRLSPPKSPTTSAATASASKDPATAPTQAPSRSPRPLTPLAPAALSASGPAAASPLESPGLGSPSKKRKAMDSPAAAPAADTEMNEASTISQPFSAGGAAGAGIPEAEATPDRPPAKKHRTNTPWTPAEERRLKAMRDENKTWSEIAKVGTSQHHGIY